MHQEHKNPKISILCPIFNVEKYIGEMIETILDQSFADWELILMDGGSQDRTGEIVRKYSEKDPRIRFFSEKDECSWHAVDKMFDLARGEFIAIVCGQDGFLDRDWLTRASETFDANSDVSLVWGLGRGMSEEGVLLPIAHSAYDHFMQKERAPSEGKTLLKKISHTIKELFSGTPERRRMLFDKLLSKGAWLQFNLFRKRGFEKGAYPQKEAWFLYWLQTGLVFPDQSMVVSKKVFLDCIPRYQLGHKTLGYMMDFYFNFNAKGYLAYFLPIDATFGRMHPGNASERAAHELHDQFLAYLNRVNEFRKKVMKLHAPITFRDRNLKTLYQKSY